MIKSRGFIVFVVGTILFILNMFLNKANGLSEAGYLAIIYVFMGIKTGDKIIQLLTKKKKEKNADPFK